GDKRGRSLKPQDAPFLALERAAYRVPSGVRGEEQAALFQASGQSPDADGEGLALVAGELLRCGVGEVLVEIQVLISDPTDSLALGPPFLALIRSYRVLAPTVALWRLLRPVSRGAGEMGPT